MGTFKAFPLHIKPEKSNISFWIEIQLLTECKEIYLEDIINEITPEIIDISIDEKNSFLESFETDGSFSQKEWQQLIKNDIETSIANRIKEKKLSLGQMYPFDIDGNRIYINQSMGDIIFNYYFLLLCSNLEIKYMTKKQEGILAALFEVYCYFYMKQFMHHYNNCKTILFGKNILKLKDEILVSRISRGCKMTKIEKLSEELRLNLSPKINPNTFKPSDNGDAGMDIVSCYFIDDKIDSNIIFSASCKCNKSYSSYRVDYFKSLFVTKSVVIYVLFVPFDDRKSDTSNIELQIPENTLLFDQYRLLTFHDNQSQFIDIFNFAIESLKSN